MVEIEEDKMNEELAKISEVAGKISNSGDGFGKKPKKAKECIKCSYRYFCKPKEYSHELYG